MIRAGTVPYERSWDWQRSLHERRVAGDIPDACLLLEHEPVYTAGKRTAAWERPVDGTPVVDVDRGGRITWHGPGQLTGYPIVALEPLGDSDGRQGVVDVVAHVRRLEEALLRTCADVGVQAVRVDGRSGVWTPDGSAKIAAIGVRVSRGVTMHGFALNADPDLASYDRIVPCGISDASVTSLSRLTGRAVDVSDVLSLVEAHLCAVLGSTPVPASPTDVGLAAAVPAGV